MYCIHMCKTTVVHIICDTVNEARLNFINSKLHTGHMVEKWTPHSFCLAVKPGFNSRFLMLINKVLLNQRSTNSSKTIGIRKVSRSKFHTQNPHILGVAIQISCPSNLLPRIYDVKSWRVVCCEGK